MSPQKTPCKRHVACATGLVPTCSQKSEAPESAESSSCCIWFTSCGHGAYDLPGIPSHLRQREERDAGAVQGEGEAARLKEKSRGGFLEEVVFEQDVNGWWMREACVSVSEYSLVPLKFASSLWPHMPCFLEDL